MNQLFKGQISCKAVFSKYAQARYYHGILAATDFYLLRIVGKNDIALTACHPCCGYREVMKNSRWWRSYHTFQSFHTYFTPGMFSSESVGMSSKLHMLTSKWMVLIISQTQRRGKIGGGFGKFNHILRGVIKRY